MKQVLLIDIPVVPVVLLEGAREQIVRKLQLETFLRQALLPGVICPPIPYTRGLLQIASALEQAGFGVSYVVWSDPKDRTRIKELARGADVVGITCMTTGHSIAAAIATEVRSLNRNACIVLGGPHATAVGSELLEQIPAIDAVVRGNGHFTMVDIAHSANLLDGIPGVSTRNCPESESRIDPYSTAPRPAYERLHRSLDQYAHSFRTYHGCPYRCAFCVEGLTWRQGSYQDLELVYEELNTVVSQLPRGTLVHFSDPVFNIDQSRTSMLCNWLTEHGSHLYLSMDTRIDLLTPDRVATLRRAGFRYFRVGVETLGSDVLNAAQKDLLTRQAVDSLKTIREVTPDVLIHAYWITGLPRSTRQTGEQAILDAEELLQEGLIDILSNKVLVPYPGSPYFKDPARFGLRLRGQPWASYDRLSFPVYDLEKICAKEIYRWFCETERAAANVMTRRLKSLQVSSYSESVETYKAIGYMNAALKLKNE